MIVWNEPIFMSSLDKSIEKATGLQPNNNDVLLGKGKFAYHHPGNTMYRRLIRQHWDAYKQARRHEEKAGIVRTIGNGIRDTGGRFLRYKHEHWEVVDHDEVHNKISHALRNRKPAYQPQAVALPMLSSPHTWQPNSPHSPLLPSPSLHRVLLSQPPSAAGVVHSNGLMVHNDNSVVEPTPITYGVPLPSFDSDEQQLLQELFGEQQRAAHRIGSTIW